MISASSPALPAVSVAACSVFLHRTPIGSMPPSMAGSVALAGAQLAIIPVTGSVSPLYTQVVSLFGSATLIGKRQ